MPTATYATQSFVDVDPSHVYAISIEYIKEREIVQGYEDGTFRPAAFINRAELTKILDKARKISIEDTQYPVCHLSPDDQDLQNALSFTDVPTDTWYAPYVCEMLIRRIVDGYPDGNFGPEKNINFAEISKIISNIFTLPILGQEPNEQWFEVYIESLENADVLPPTYQQPDQSITRGEMAFMIHKAIEYTQTHKDFHSKTGRFSVRNSANWYLVEYTPTYVEFLRTSPFDSSTEYPQEQVSFAAQQIVDENVTLEEYVTHQYLPYLQSLFSEDIATSTHTTFDAGKTTFKNMPAWHTDIVILPYGEEESYKLQKWVLLQDDMIYVFEYYAPERTYEQFRQEAWTIINSLFIQQKDITHIQRVHPTKPQVEIVIENPFKWHKANEYTYDSKPDATIEFMDQSMIFSSEKMMSFEEVIADYQSKAFILPLEEERTTFLQFDAYRIVYDWGRLQREDVIFKDTDGTWFRFRMDIPSYLRTYEDEYQNIRSEIWNTIETTRFVAAGSHQDPHKCNNPAGLEYYFGRHITNLERCLNRDEKVARKIAIHMIVEMTGGANSDLPQTSSFADIATDSPYFAHFETAARKGWYKGEVNCYGQANCNANPDQFITWNDAAAMIVESFGLTKKGHAEHLPIYNAASTEEYARSALDHCVIYATESTVHLRLEREMIWQEWLKSLHAADNGSERGKDC